jgi:hypothetical protein
MNYFRWKRTNGNKKDELDDKELDVAAESCGPFILKDKPLTGDHNMELSTPDYPFFCRAFYVRLVDIVAVHGLGGHWQNIWAHQNGKLWLCEFLPS